MKIFIGLLNKILTRFRYRMLRRRLPHLKKANFGCGNSRLDGYINFDIVKTAATDMRADISDPGFLDSNFFEEIRLDAAFEHLYRWQQKRFLNEAHRALRPGGRLVINWLPDFDCLIDAYVKGDRGLLGPIFDIYEVYRFTHGDPNKANSPHQLHKDIFSKASITFLLEQSGFVNIDVKNTCYKKEHIPLNLCVIAEKAGA